MGAKKTGLRRGIVLLIGMSWMTWLFAQTPQGQGSPPPANPPASPPAATQQKSQPGSTVLGNGAYALVPVASLSQLKPNEEKKDDDSMTGLVAVLAWPLTTIFLTFFVLRQPNVRSLFDRISQGNIQLTVAGLEIKLNQRAAATIEDLQKLISQVPATHRDWIANTHIQDQFRRVLRELRAYLCEDQPAPPFSAMLPEDEFNKFRFTLHVPDIVLTHCVRQLVDYSDGKGGRAGRIFSTRRGIIGLAWRLEKSRYKTDSYSQNQLVEFWGMTRDEAEETTHSTQVLLVFLIKSSQRQPLGMLYGDASSSTLFNAARLTTTPDQAFEKLAAKVQHFCDTLGLTKSLLDLAEARKDIKQVDIFRTPST